ncbi:polar amino acid transport system substrate-binding protein [Candidatus Magnetomoraceae bacterium gMMP-15]
MKKFFITLIMITLIFWSSANVFAGKLVFAASIWPPYTMSENGQVSGLDIEIVRKLCNHLGLEAEFQLLPWKRALKYAENGKTDAILAPRYTKERAEFLYYTSESINIEKTVLISLKGSGIKITGLDDLKGRVVGVVRGYTHNSEFDNYPGIKKEECDDDVQLIKMLVRGRIPFAVSCDEGAVKYLCKQINVEVEVLYVLNESSSYIGFSRAIGEKGKILAEKFSQILRQLKEEGVVQKIENTYY